MKPYTYLLHHIPTRTFYYGVRWANGCDPSEFWIKYFTSSKHIALLRTLFGDESFEFEIRRVFIDKQKAREWEHRVLRRMKVLDKQEIWVNKTDNKSIYNKHGPNLGKTLPYMKGTSYGKKNKGRASPTKNMIWITNGSDEKMIHKNGIILGDWYIGRNYAHTKNVDVLKKNYLKLKRINGRFSERDYRSTGINS